MLPPDPVSVYLLTLRDIRTRPRIQPLILLNHTLMDTFIDGATILLLAGRPTARLSLEEVGVLSDRAGGVFVVRGGLFVRGAFLSAEHYVFLDGLAN